MIPKKDDKVFIENCALINKNNFITDIEYVYKSDSKIFVKLLGELWFDVTNFEYDNEQKFWRDIQPNNDEKALVKL
jgi:hypothetical protein